MSEFIDENNSNEKTLARLSNPMPVGSRTSTSTATAAVVSGATAVQLLAANDQRNGMVITNTHATDAVWVRFRAFGTDSAKEGFRLDAGEKMKFDGLNVYSGEVSIVANSGTPSAQAMEW